MRSLWKFDTRVWKTADAGSPLTVIFAATLLVSSIFIVPVIADKFLDPRLSVADIMIFSAMPGIIAYRFFCAEKLPLTWLKKGEIIKIAGMAFGAFLLCAAVSSVWETVLKLLNIPFDDQQYALTLVKNSSGMERVKLFFAMCVFTPLIEELLFRRIVYGALLNIGVVTAFFCTALIFSICHFFILGIPGLFILGLLFQFAYLRFRNLTAAVVMHAVFNTISFLGAISLPEM